jgi:hypothetical protein
VNHVAVEDAQAALDIIIGMIFVNDNNAIVLFDSGASHSFVAASFVQKYNLPLSKLKNRMIVSSPRGDMHARHVCPGGSGRSGGQNSSTFLPMQPERCGELTRAVLE